MEFSVFIQTEKENEFVRNEKIPFGHFIEHPDGTVALKIFDSSGYHYDGLVMPLVFASGEPIRNRFVDPLTPKTEWKDLGEALITVTKKTKENLDT